MLDGTVASVAGIWQWIGINAAAIQAVCVVCGTVAAFLVIAHAGLISRREATIQMVNSQFGEEGVKYADFKNLIAEFEEKNINIAELAQENLADKAHYDIILRQVNRYELISLGIKQRVFNEKFYKRWFFSQVMRDWSKLEPFIMETRRLYKNDAYFCEFETLAKRWCRKRHPVKHPPKWQIAWWILIGKMVRAKAALEAR